MEETCTYRFAGKRDAYTATWKGTCGNVISNDTSEGMGFPDEPEMNFCVHCGKRFKVIPWMTTARGKRDE